MKKLMIAGVAMGVLLLAALAWALWPRAEKKTPAPSLQARAAASVDKLRQTTSQASAKLALEELKRALRQMDTSAALEWLAKELFKTEDVETHLNLTIGPDQNLLSWPSYRVFLLDMLFLIDPPSAAKLSRDLLGYPEVTMDEFAIMLRNLARAGQGEADTALLKSALARMLANKEWQASASTAYLEAFDVIVHARDVSLVPQLLQLRENTDNPKLRQAAFLTLERLTQAKGAEVLPLLDEHAAAHPGSRPMVSNLFARADMRDAGQRAAVAAYLQNPARTPEEVQGFASAFPNTTMAASNNLVTRQKGLSLAEQVEWDRAALDAVVVWLSDPRFARWRPVLQETYQRLSSFVKP